MRSFATLFGVLTVVTICSGQDGPKATNAPKSESDLTAADWGGVYSSTSEISPFTGTVLSIERDELTENSFRKRFNSCVVFDDRIEQDVIRGEYLTDGNKIYFAEATGSYRNGKPSINGRITRMTRVTINGHLVLMRDDALEAYRKEKKLYDYGVLIRVSDKPLRAFDDLPEVKRPSIKILYGDPKKPWHDPFVHGPNEP